MVETLQLSRGIIEVSVISHLGKGLEDCVIDQITNRFFLNLVLLNSKIIFSNSRRLRNTN